ncbi:MAG: tetratricopeptide repeat protein [Cyanobacteria bacterium J06642_11]
MNDAEIAYTQALEASPNSSSIYNALGKLLLQQERESEAEAPIAKLSELAQAFQRLFMTWGSCWLIDSPMERQKHSSKQ